MRRIAFALTTDAVLQRRKTVTRRLGWKVAKPGMRLLAVDKLRTKNARRLAVIEIVSVRREPLSAITARDVKRECFGKNRVDFVLGFLAANHMLAHNASDVEVTRIQFEYVDCDGCGERATCVRSDDAAACQSCCGHDGCEALEVPAR